MSKSLRFGVGRDPSLRSSAWSLWTSKKTDDVYVAQRSHAGEFKISLHQSGVFRAAFEEGYAGRDGSVVEAGEDRLLQRWKRPAPVYTGGPTHACSVVIPWFSLHGLRERGGPEGMFWYTAPPPGYAVNFDVYFRQDGSKPWAGAPLLGFDSSVGERVLPSGAGVGVYALTRQMTEPELDRIGQFLEAARQRDWSHRPGMVAQTSATFTIMHPDGAAWFVDILIEKATDATGLWEAEDRGFSGRGSWRDLVQED